ncbi:MAG: ArnT family glycosyltransferase [Phycisphaerae bacterium]
MTLPAFHREAYALHDCPSPGRTLLDLTLIYLLVAVAVVFAAHAPSHTYSYAQMFQINAAIDLVHGGNWLMPEYHNGHLFRKPPQYAWLLAGVFKLTGRYDEVIFRIPGILASMVTVTLVYLLGKRWYSRRAGLLAGCFWVTAMHMSKLLFVALTDPLLTAWMTGSVFTLDRVLFHPAPSRDRWKWVVAFWITIIGGAMSKGWGIANIPLIALFALLAVTLGPGFGLLRKVRGVTKATLAIRLVWRRVWSSARKVKLGWGLLAVAAVIVPYLWYLWTYGGPEYRWIIEFEIFQRITGSGEGAPRAGSLPTPVYLLYYDLPVSVLAISALLLISPKRWLSRKSPTALPLYWVLAVLLPYTISHGFRPDYLWPCYGATALLAGWGLDRLMRQAAVKGPMPRVGYEIYRAAAAILFGAVLLGCGLYLFRSGFPEAIDKNLPAPWYAAPETRTLLKALLPLAGVLLVVSIWASLTWRPRLLAGLIVTAMLGIHFLDTHFVSPHARSGDGLKMRDFALSVREELQPGEPLILFRAEKLCIEPYLGRFGTYYSVYHRPKDETHGEAARRVLGRLEDHAGELLVTCDRGLVDLGAAQQREGGKYKLGSGRRYTTYPGQLGEVIRQSARIGSQKWGTAYLIRLKNDINPSGEPHRTGLDSYRGEDEW